MTDGLNYPANLACGHTVELGTCTLPAGHQFGHHDERDEYAQWWDASDDHGPGAYRSIHPGDAVWRHEPGACVRVGARRQATWCLWCLRRDRSVLLNALDDCVMAFDLPGDHCEMQDAIDQARILLDRHAKQEMVA